MDNPVARQRFFDEAALTGELEHPGIVTVFDSGVTDQGRAFYAMRLARGKPWSSRLAKNSLTKNMEILQRVAEATAFAHSRGIVHADIKPSNVLVGDDGGNDEVWLGDWGVALRLRDAAHPQGVWPKSAYGGTPAYRAPELAGGDASRIGAATDIYALGAVLHELLLGAPPTMDGESVADAANVEDKFRQRFTSARERRMASQAYVLARQAMDSAPERRPPTTLHFAGALALIVARNETPRTSRGRRILRMLFMALGWIAAAALAWPMISVWQRQREEAQTRAVFDTWSLEDAVQTEYFAEVHELNKVVRELRNLQEDARARNNPEAENEIALFRAAEQAVSTFTEPAKRLSGLIMQIGAAGIGLGVDSEETDRPHLTTLGNKARAIANTLAHTMRGAANAPAEETLAIFDEQLAALDALIVQCEQEGGTRPLRLVKSLSQDLPELRRQRAFVAVYAETHARMVAAVQPLL